MADVMIRRFGVLSSAKISGLMGAIMGLVIGVPYGLFIMFIGSLATSSGGKSPFPMGEGGPMIFALILMAVVPIMYGILGFIFGAIYAFFYNVIAGMFGGLEMELQNVD